MNKLFFIGLILFFSSCALKLADNYNSDFDPITKKYSKNIGEIEFTLRPIDSEKLASINYDLKNISKQERDSILKDYNDFTCFVFEISIKGFNGNLEDYNVAGIRSNYEKKVQYYLFEMQNDINLRSEKQSIPCSLFYNEKINELSHCNRFVVGFKNVNDDMYFEYDNPHLNCGKINFQLDKNHLASK